MKELKEPTPALLLADYGDIQLSYRTRNWHLIEILEKPDEERNPEEKDYIKNEATRIYANHSEEHLKTYGKKPPAFTTLSRFEISIVNPPLNKCRIAVTFFRDGKRYYFERNFHAEYGVAVIAFREGTANKKQCRDARSILGIVEKYLTQKTESKEKISLKPKNCEIKVTFPH